MSTKITELLQNLISLNIPDHTERQKLPSLSIPQITCFPCTPSDNSQNTCNIFQKPRKDYSRTYSITSQTPSMSPQLLPSRSSRVLEWKTLTCPACHSLRTGKYLLAWDQSGTLAKALRSRTSNACTSYPAAIAKARMYTSVCITWKLSPWAPGTIYNVPCSSHIAFRSSLPAHAFTSLSLTLYKVQPSVSSYEKALSSAFSLQIVLKTESKCRNGKISYKAGLDRDLSISHAWRNIFPSLYVPTYPYSPASPDAVSFWKASERAHRVLAPTLHTDENPKTCISFCIYFVIDSCTSSSATSPPRNRFSTSLRC